MRKILIMLMMVLAGTATTSANDATDVTPIDDLSTYKGSDTYVYNRADEKVYVLNNLGEYEEYGILQNVQSLNVIADTEIEYIETNETMSVIPYINTGYIHKADTRIVIDFELNGHHRSWEAPFGARNGSFNNNAFVFFSRSHNNSNTGAFNRSGYETQGEVDLETGQRYTLDAYQQTCYIYESGDDQPYSTIITPGTPDDGVNAMFIFDLNTAGVGSARRDYSASLMKLYNFKIYEGDQLIMDLQPIVSPDYKVGLKDKVSGIHFYSEEYSQPFDASPDAPMGIEPTGITVYEGKIVANLSDGHAYEWKNGKWKDLGLMLRNIEDTTYKDMRNWQCPEGKEACFAGLTYDPVNDKNHIEDYIGGSNFEPFFCQFPTIEGENYQVSFNYSCDAWETWNTDRNNPDNYMRAVVLDTALPNINFTENGNSMGGRYGVRARYQLPRTETRNHQVVMNFTAGQDHEYLLLQYGYVADEIPYDFDYDNITISQITSPKQYSFTPYLSALVNIAENTDIVTSAKLMNALREAVKKARALYDSDDVEAQKVAYGELKAALQAALDYTPIPEEGNLIINELMASNPDVYMSPAKNFDSWIELYNTTDQAFALEGCYLSDDASNLTKWKMPKEVGKIGPKGHLVIWLGSDDILANQAPFKLDCEGGIIILTNNQGDIVAQQTYPAALNRCSYARTTDGGANWSWTGFPTLELTNDNSVYATRQQAAPTVSKDGQLFDGQMNISVNIPSGATLRYTTDGTTPTMENGETSTTGIFTCNSTTTFRFRLYRDHYLPSPVTSRTYITRDYDFTLPVISVATDQKFLYDDMIGVYVKGHGGKTGNGQSTPANWNMPWDRPVFFQYIQPETNEMVVNQECDFKISGGWTRANDPKAFKLKADRKFDGRNAFDYPFFAMKPFNKNKTLQVRAGGNDTGSRIKDAAIQNIIQRSGLNIDIISYQPAVHYINGQYRGLINVREPNNKDYAYANFGLSKEEIEVFEQSPDSGRYMMVGTMETLNRLDELSENCTDPANYEEIKQLLDIDEYINYMAAELYLGSWDWPDNNVKGYRKLDNGKYRIVLFDVDAAFDTDGRDYGESGTYLGGNFFRWVDDMQWHTFDYIYDTGQRMYGEQKFCTFFLNMLENDDFRRRFIDAFCIVAGSVFDETRASAILVELGNRVRTTMSWQGQSPDGSLNSIRSHLRNRFNTKVGHMMDYERFRLQDATPHAATLSANVEGAKLLINNQEVPYATYGGYLFPPVRLRAEAPAGYKFDGWKKASSTVKTFFQNGSTWKYYDQGALDGQNWYANNYDDSFWLQGEAPLGFGKQEATTLDYGGDAQHKRPTYYFRTTMPLDIKPNSSTSISLDFIADDGFIIYVNGKEAGRYNMPVSDVSYETMSATDAKSNPDKGSLQLDASLFKQGYNTVAVEVHNCNWTSTDIVWEASLSYSNTSTSNNLYSTDAEIDMPTDQSFNMQAVFTKMTQAEMNEQGQTDICVNEVSCANSIFVNDYFKRNDWVELYNSTDDDIDIEGMYLSNDASNPQKWQITKGNSIASTVVPAHGYIVIWCDKLDPVSQLHAPFKLEAEGGVVTLMAKDGSWKNVLTYAAHNGDETVCRYPDGGNNAFVTNMPTIEKSNLYTSYFEGVTQTPSGITQQRFVSNNNGLKIRYAENRLVIRSESTGPGTVAVYSLSGQELMSTSVALRNDRSEVDITDLPAGCYVSRVTDSEGNIASCKFIKSK